MIFSCPAGADCPPLSLPGASESGPAVNETVASVMCPNHHAGPLCAVCDAGFSLAYQKLSDSAGEMSRSSCVACENTSEYIKRTFGIAVGWFVIIALAVVALGCTLAYRARGHLRRFKVNFRIILGAVQVWALLPAVLQLVFPGSSGYILHFFALFVADVRDIVRFECWGWTWWTRWLAAVLGVPAVAALPVVAFWLWQQRKIKALKVRARKRAYNRAWDQCVAALLFEAMLLYPQTSSAILSALRCRKLGPELAVLEADYSEDCITDSLSGISVLAYALVVLVPLGLPATLWAVLRSQHKDSAREWDVGLVSGRMPAGMAAIVAAQGSQHDFQSKKAADAFGFIVEDYREDCYWYEPVDLLRKLALSGLLRFVHRGTAAQCFCGCGIAFVSFGLQQWLRPYNEWESNVLKACVDTQLFLTFLISFILRVLPQMDTAEPFEPVDYGWLLVGSLVLLMVAFVGLTISESRRNKIWVASTVTFLSARIEQIQTALSNRLSGRFAGADAVRPPQNPTASSSSSSRSIRFTEGPKVALLEVNRSRASSLDENDL